MAAITYTFLDALQAVWVLLHGQKYAETEAGTAIVKDCINRAQAEVPAELGSLMFAGGLYATTTIAGTGSADSFSLSAITPAVLAPLVAEVKDATSTYGSAFFATPERILALSRTKLASAKHFNYGFMGLSVLVRPIVGATGSVIVHYIKVPDALSGDSDALAADPRLFRAICLKAAWMAMQKFPSVDPARLEQIQKDMTAELGRLEALKMAAKVEEYEVRTGRDVSFGGQAPGQGG